MDHSRSPLGPSTTSLLGRLSTLNSPNRNFSNSGLSAAAVRQEDRDFLQWNSASPGFNPGTGVCMSEEVLTAQITTDPAIGGGKPLITIGERVLIHRRMHGPIIRSMDVTVDQQVDGLDGLLANHSESSDATSPITCPHTGRPFVPSPIPGSGVDAVQLTMVGSGTNQ